MAVTRNEMSTISTYSSLKHFMDLEERKDLLRTLDVDPLAINGPEVYDSFEGVFIKQEMPDDAEVSNVTLTEVPLRCDEPRPCDEFISHEQIRNKTSEAQAANSQLISSETNHKTEHARNENSECNRDNSDNYSDSGSVNDEECEVSSSVDAKKKIEDRKTLSKSKEGRYKTIPYKCDICNKLLVSKGNLRLHKKKKHNIVLAFTCKLCSAMFSLHRDLVGHRNKAHREKDGRFACKECGKRSADYHNHLAHIKMHYASGDSVDVSSLAEHNDVASACSSENSLVCEECGKVFKKQEKLRVHRSLIHDSGILTKARLKPQEKNNTCDVCGKQFMFGCLLRDHMNIHTGEKPYLCVKCGRVFAQKASLKQHSKIHSETRPFPCPECTMAFFGKGDLKKHMRKHTGERPYVCEVCGDGFLQSSHLGVHLRSHTGERPYECDVCARGFAERGDVVGHQRIHTGELPYLCHVCGKAFRQSTQCGNHIKKHHPVAAVKVLKNPASILRVLLTKQ